MKIAEKLLQIVLILILCVGITGVIISCSFSTETRESVKNSVRVSDSVKESDSEEESDSEQESGGLVNGGNYKAH